MFIEHQFSILEGFLKDHVIVKTGVMTKFSFAITGRKKNIKKIDLNRK